ncbi:MAG: alpha/beta hydrolase [Alphaproteobacteria bacterium]|nr:alpha/beta hydrolase [Alphaproteobacteria bacterium]
MRPLLLAPALILAACATETPAPPPAPEAAVERPISWRDLLDRPREAADVRIAYGEGEHQYGELWLPDASRHGDGPFPLVIMVHGGCWRAEIPGTILQDQLNADLRARGIAVWNITYPRVGHETGGYPGTFRSVAMAVDEARDIAREHPVDLTRTAIMGHSAGGHLALWAAARGQLGLGIVDGVASEPFIPGAAITLAGINDLEAYHARGPGRCGEPEIVDQLIDSLRRATADPYADTSPAAMLPLGVEQVVISGALDPIVPPALGMAYAAQAEIAGDAVTVITLEEAGHFELIDPTAPAWEVILAELERVLD